MDDNFHCMDEDKRYKYSSFETLDAAIDACRRIVEREVTHIHKSGMSAKELYDSFTAFDEDPFMRGAGEGVPFSARAYAREIADKMCAADPSGSREDPADDGCE